MPVGKLLLALVLFLSGCSRPARGSELRPRACQRGGGAYCSVGRKHSGYIGFLDTTHQLRQALEATAFRQEVIVFAETRVSEASQTLARLTGMAGYAHVLPVLESVSDCDHLSHVLAPWQPERGPLSCGAYSSEDERGSGYPHKLRYFKTAVGGSPAWWAKWLTVARAVALGYNVMAVDSDVVVLDDWYWRAKQPPLAGYTMLSQGESYQSINGGFTYVQNAASNGPVSWLLYEAMFRLVRWSEDPSVIANASRHVARTGDIPVDDQTLLTDGMLSCVAGRPVFHSLSAVYRRDPQEEAFRYLGLSGFQDFWNNILSVINRFQAMVYDVTGPLAEHVCDKRATGPCESREGGQPARTVIQTATLRMPHSGGEWPPKLGGYPFGKQLGPLALAYREAFTDLGVPLPPDPEDPTTVGAAAATPPERVGLLNIEYGGEFFGSWAESTWWSAGRLGYWHQHLWPHQQPPLPAQQAIGHIFAGLFPGDFQKTIVLQLTGHYDWRVASRVAGSPLGVFLTQQGPMSQLGLQGADIRLVVAYGPDVIPQGLGKRRFIRAAQGLAKVAAALGAVAAWPAAPCKAPWTQTRDQRQRGAAGAQQPPGTAPNGASSSTRPWNAIPWTQLDTAYTVQPFGDSLNGLLCEWVGFSYKGCILANDPTFGPDAADGGRGLLAVEFHHLRQVLGPVANTSDLDGVGERAQVHSQTQAQTSGGGSGGHLEGGSRDVSRLHRRRRLQPRPETTLRLSQEDPRAAAESPPPTGVFSVRYGDLVILNGAALKAAAARDGITVLWLDRLVGDVVGMDGEAAQVYERWSSRCPALHYYDLPEEQRGNW